MTHYTHKKLNAWRMIGMALRGLVSLLRLWPLAALAVLVISPIGPHLLWTYTYQDVYGVRIYTGCQYFGSRGLTDYMKGDDCPLVTIINRRTH